MMSEPTIICLDVETAPFEVWSWGLWDVNVGLDQIKTEWSLLAFCAKWVGSKKMVYMDTGGRGAKKVRDDSALLDALWEILDEADIVVAQNGKRFDLKKINARMIMAGMKPYSPVRVIDTMLEAKKHFDFSSNKLAWLSKYLTDTPKSEHKSFPGFELWRECLADNPRAWAEMRRYNIQDVASTEKLYFTLRPWISSHPSMAVYRGGEQVSCPKCDSISLEKRGTVATQTGLFQRFRCNACGGWSRAKATQSTPSKRKSLLVST